MKRYVKENQRLDFHWYRNDCTRQDIIEASRDQSLPGKQVFGTRRFIHNSSGSKVHNTYIDSLTASVCTLLQLNK